MGDYKGAIAYIRDAISLTVPETDHSAKNDKLYSRLVKCFLYLHDVDSAEMPCPALATLVSEPN